MNGKKKSSQGGRNIGVETIQKKSKYTGGGGGTGKWDWSPDAMTSTKEEGWWDRKVLTYVCSTGVSMRGGDYSGKGRRGSLPMTKVDLQREAS